MARPLRHLGLALLASTALAGCTVDSGVHTTPTFSAARYLPADPTPAAAPVPGPTPAPTAFRVPAVTGVKAITRANASATVDPDDTTLRGATWFIEDVDSSLIYRVRTAVGRVTTILLPPGERFNGAVGGDVDGYLVNVAYAGPRPAVSILPRSGAAHGNLQLVTTGGFYSFDLVTNANVALNLIDVGREPSTPPRPAADRTPQPRGDFTRLVARPVESEVLPAWTPAEAWADSDELVVRFDGPLPVLPTLFAGRRGEQLVSYRSLAEGNQVFLVTSRRVTEAELRLGEERVRITVDPDAVAAGTAADPALGAAGWRPASPLHRDEEAVPLIPQRPDEDDGSDPAVAPPPEPGDDGSRMPRQPAPPASRPVPPGPAQGAALPLHHRPAPDAPAPLRVVAEGPAAARPAPAVPVAVAFPLLGLGIGRTLGASPARARPVLVLPRRDSLKDT